MILIILIITIIKNYDNNSFIVSEKGYLFSVRYVLSLRSAKKRKRTL